MGGRLEFALQAERRMIDSLFTSWYDGLLVDWPSVGVRRLVEAEIGVCVLPSEGKPPPIMTHNRLQTIRVADLFPLHLPAHTP